MLISCCCCPIVHGYGPEPWRRVADVEMNSAAQAEMIDNQDAALGDEITVWPLDACSMLWLAGTADESVRYRGCGAMSRRLYGVVVCLLVCYLSVISSAMRIRDQVGDVPVLVPVQQQQTHVCCWLMFWANMHISADRLLVLPPEAIGGYRDTPRREKDW